MDQDPRNEFRASHLKISEEIEEKGPWSRVVGDGTEVLGGTGRRAVGPSLHPMRKRVVQPSRMGLSSRAQEKR